MRFEPSCCYEKMLQRESEGQTAVAWISRECEDACWDKFLQETPLGQFQQSTIWARSKEPGGWKPVRIILTLDDKIVGGFQLLVRSNWWGRIGYVSKGPVVLAESIEMADFTTELLRNVSHTERLRALVVQPPDSCERMPSRLSAGGFLPDISGEVNEATWILDLHGDFQDTIQRIGGKTRQKVRQALNRGVTLREGGRQDIELFFDLMLSTCRRQGVSPNPPDVRHLLALWDAAEPAGCIRLFFAEYEGKPLTGLLCISFGSTFTQWKRGWTSSEARLHPNDLITYEALKWANLNGHQSCDFAAFDRRMAVSILNGEPLSQEQERSRHWFTMCFGGRPQLLPASRVYFPNPLIRAAYRVLFYKKIRREENNDRTSAGSGDDNFSGCAHAANTVEEQT